MKKFVALMSTVTLFSTATLLSSAAFAVNPRILSVSATMFPGESMPFYAAEAQGALLKVGTDFCQQFGEKLDKVTNVVIQLQSEFEPDAGATLKATTHPQTNYSGLVSCKAK